MFHFDQLGWGTIMTLAGMGTVFALLAVLMLLLLFIGWLDQHGQRVAERKALQGGSVAVVRSSKMTEEPSAVVSDIPKVEILHDGLTREQIAAVTAAVITHVRVRRAQAAPAMRAHDPGSHLFASRWVSIGRGQQTTSWRRN